MITFYDENCNEFSSVLPLDESRHAIKSLRIRPKERFDVVNGNGLILKCEASEQITDPLQYTILNVEKAVEKKPFLHIAISPLKQSDRFEYFIEKSIELGVNEITPLLCARTEKHKVKSARLERIIISALKQSGNPFKPKINPAIDMSTFIKNCTVKPAYICHCLEEEKTDLKELSFTEDTVFVIGPEGDFNDAEINLALSHHFIPLSLGDYTLRTETAGLTACAYFQLSK